MQLPCSLNPLYSLKLRRGGDDKICWIFYKIDLSSFRDRVGHAPTGGGTVGLLEMIVWKTLQF
jgi:hypothetical protein